MKALARRLRLNALSVVNLGWALEWDMAHRCEKHVHFHAQIILTSALWQAVLLVSLLAGAVSFISYIILHFVGCAALCAVIIRWRGDEISSILIQILVWSLLGGFFGNLIAIALSVRCQLLGVDHTKYMESNTSEINIVERVYSLLRDHRMRVQGAHRICPLVDVIRDGSKEEKLEALRIVYKNYGADLNLVLKIGFEDGDASVRVLAATVSAKLHGKFTRNIGECQAEAANNPKLVENWIKLADARISYAESGLLEPTRAAGEIESATRALSRAAEIDPVGEETRTRLAKLKAANQVRE